MGLFSAWEMRCRCGRKECDAVPMDPAFMRKLEALRVEWGRPLSPTSARRCRYHNANSGGEIDSYHLRGRATDFLFVKKADIENFVVLAEKYGFGGIGTGKALVHIDDRKKRARWSY